MSRQQEIVKLRAEIDQIETQRIIQRINKNKIWLFERINRKDKSLVKLTKGPGGSFQMNKVRNKKGDITTETEEIQKPHQIPL